ncbi:MAG: hypothetical protein WC343_03730 [Bacilli bacterium]|jgi:hypothetical protein
MRDNREELMILEEQLLLINQDNCDLSKLVKLFEYEEWGIFEKTINNNLDMATDEITKLDMSNFMINDEKKVYLNNLLIRINIIRQLLAIPLKAEQKLNVNNNILENLKAKILSIRKKTKL